jgi:hypothetical protein
MSVIIKKDFQELIAFLEANEKKSVKTILEQVRELCSAKAQVTFKKDAEGNVTHVFCYYHKVWEEATNYGKKVSNKATGLNTMCKVGLNQWTKQQREAKKAKDALLTKIASGEVPQEQLTAELEAIEAARNVIV